MTIDEHLAVNVTAMLSEYQFAGAGCLLSDHVDAVNTTSTHQYIRSVKLREKPKFSSTPMMFFSYARTCSKLEHQDSIMNTLQSTKVLERANVLVHRNICIKSVLVCYNFYVLGDGAVSVY